MTARCNLDLCQQGTRRCPCPTACHVPEGEPEPKPLVIPWWAAAIGWLAVIFLLGAASRLFT